MDEKSTSTSVAVFGKDFLKARTSAPKAVAGYRLVKELGRGGYGQVWLGEDIRGKKVAIKIYELDGETLRREVACLQALRDMSGTNERANCIEGVPGYMNHGQLKDGTFYLIEEYVPGDMLVEWCRRDGCDPREAEDLLVKILEVVETVHQTTKASLKIVHVHCDLKPANIIRTRGGKIVVLDFGSARKNRQVGSVTATVGSASYGYAAPEVYAGRSPTPASDVYSIGVIGFEMLIGDKFSDTEKYAHKFQLLEALDQSGGSRQLVEAIKKAVSDEVSQRFATPGEFLEFLCKPVIQEMGLGRVKKVMPFPEEVIPLWLRGHAWRVGAFYASLSVGCLLLGLAGAPLLLHMLRAISFKVPEAPMVNLWMLTTSIAVLVAAYLVFVRVILKGHHAKLRDVAQQAILHHRYDSAVQCYGAAATHGDKEASDMLTKLKTARARYGI
jgi:serine/threonine protein kinase